MDVHTSILEGSTGAIRRRLMVRDSDHFLAVAVMRDNGIPTDG